MKVLEWHIYPNVLEDKYIFIDFNPASIQKHKQNPHYRYLNGTTQTEKEEEEKKQKTTTTLLYIYTILGVGQLSLNYHLDIYNQDFKFYFILMPLGHGFS